VPCPRRTSLQITGSAAARGRLEIDAAGTARGVLGGRRVEAVRSAAAARVERAWLTDDVFPRAGMRAASGATG
jgi:hypothetical protein